MGMKKLIAYFANKSGVLGTYSFLRGRFAGPQAVILLYHRVAPKQDELFPGALSPEAFERQIQYLCRTYEPLSLGKLVEYTSQKRSLSEKAVVITFDDGYKDNYRYAYPILKKYHVTATIFLATGYIGAGKLFWWDKVKYAVWKTPKASFQLGKLGSYSLSSTADRVRATSIICEKLKKLPDEDKNNLVEELAVVCDVNFPSNLGSAVILSWDDVKEMASGGINFGAHSVSHSILTNISLELAKREIDQSRRDIEEKLGQAVIAFAYPNGDFNSEIVHLVKESGFSCAVTAIPRLINTRADPYELGRVSPGEDFGEFRVMLSELYSDLKTLRT